MESKKPDVQKFTLRMHHNLYEVLREAAYNTRESMNDLINAALDKSYGDTSKRKQTGAKK